MCARPAALWQPFPGSALAAAVPVRDFPLVPLLQTPPAAGPLRSFCLLESQPSVVGALLDKAVRQVVYLTHGSLPALHAVAQHVRMCQQG